MLINSNKFVKKVLAQLNIGGTDNERDHICNSIKSMGHV